MLTPFLPQHLAAMSIQAGQAHEMVSQEQAEYAQHMGPSWSLLKGEEVAASGGLFVVSPHLAIGWAYLSKDAGPSMVQIVRAMRAAIKSCPTERIDFLVHDEFPQAHRMAKVLKAVETRKINVTSRDGQTRAYTVYSRGRDGWH